ncbi:hypothetical protein BDZ45DRAFT_804344 [Acephala macrosclerotiorum]|nr:hypothetical protein BDZ45DRAFT_804344 [Acephala macrosclerotiorum]
MSPPPYRVQLFDTSPNESPHAFQLYVTPKSPAVPSSIETFPEFSELPSELQLEIISFCDESTLIEYQWLSHGDRFPGPVSDCPDILPHVEQVEILAIFKEFSPMLKILPNVKRVVLAEKTALNVGEGVPNALTKVLHACPDKFTVFAALIRPDPIRMLNDTGEPAIEEVHRTGWAFPTIGYMARVLRSRLEHGIDCSPLKRAREITLMVDAYPFLARVIAAISASRELEMGTTCSRYELEARLNEFCQAEVELELDNLQPKGLCGAAGNEKRRQFVRRIRSSNRMSNVNSRLSEPETLMHDTGTLGSPLGVALLHQQRIKVSLAARLPRIERRSISIDISRSRAVASSWMQAPSRRDEQVMSVNIHTNHAKIGHPRPNTNNFKVQLRLNTGI